MGGDIGNVNELLVMVRDIWAIRFCCMVGIDNIWRGKIMEGLHIAVSSIPIEGHTGCKHLRNIGNCHPCYGLEWSDKVCLHLAWPSNKHGDFPPSVECGGEASKCCIDTKLLRRYRNGLRARVRNAQAKLVKAEQNLNEFYREGLLR